MRRHFKAFLALLVCISPLSAQQPKVLAPHRPVPPLLPVSLKWEQPATLHSMVGGFWMIDANFKSSIYLKNDVKIAPISVTPILYLSNGAKYALPDVNLEPSGTAVVSINDGLQAKGISSWATLSGYVEIQYTFPFSAICATVQSVDPVHSLIFGSGLSGFTPIEPGSSGPQTQTLEGLWWKQESNVTGFVALSNTTGAPIHVAVHVTDSLAAVLGRHSVVVSPHGTKIVNLSELQTAVAREGGIEIRYTGASNNLIIYGGLEDTIAGYSAALPFRTAPEPSAKSTTEEYAVPGLMAGAADPMMLFPVGTEFTPYSVLRNISDQPISVVPTLHWTAQATPHSAQLGAVVLKPLQTQMLDVPSMMSQAGLKAFNGNLTLVLKVQGSPFALLMATGSVDAKNTYVFEVRPDSVSESIAKLLSYWSIGNGDDTMVSLWNPADEAQELIFTLWFSGGHYKFPIHLSPKQSYMLNVSEIIHNQIPDEEGNVVPSAIHEGSAELSGSKGENEYILVALASGTYNVRKATCGIYCQHCDGIATYGVLADPFAVEVSGTTQLAFTARLHSGSTQNLTAYSNWSSSSTSVATVSTGLVSGHSPGTLDALATTADPQLIYSDICNSNPPPCPERTVSGGSSGTVHPTVTISCDITNMAVGTFAATGTCSTSNVSPSGGSFTWETGSSAISLSCTNSGCGSSVKYTAKAASKAEDDTTITVTYTVNGQSADETSDPITVHQPTSLRTNSTTPTTTTCTLPCLVQKGSCATKSGTSCSFSAPETQRSYSVLDQFGNAFEDVNLGAGAGITEQVSRQSGGGCSPGNIATGTSSLSPFPDTIHWCDSCCESGGPGCTFSASQTIFSNGINVRQESISITCTSVTLTP